MTQFYTPELEKLKHSYLSQDYMKESPYAGLYKGYMEQLATPSTMTAGLTPQQLAAQTGQIRGSILGGTKALMGDMESRMRGSGMAPGESGRADTALGGVARTGQQQLSSSLTSAALENARQEKANELSLGNLNLQRMLGAGQFGNLLESSATNRMNTGLSALGAGGNLEQFEKNYGLDQQRIGQTGRSLGLQEEQFGYGKEMDAIKLLQSLYGQERGYESERYAPYWNAQGKY